MRPARSVDGSVRGLGSRGGAAAAPPPSARWGAVAVAAAPAPATAYCGGRCSSPAFASGDVWSTCMVVSWQRHGGVRQQWLAWPYANVAVLAAAMRWLTNNTMVVGLVTLADSFYCVDDANENPSFLR